MKIYPTRYCEDLPTSPISGHKVLVTGATGYIGGELIPELVARGYQVRVMVRSVSPEYTQRWPGLEVVKADALNLKELKRAVAGVDSAYYLMHSLYLKDNKYKQIDNLAAYNFRMAAEEYNLQRIIYLGGLGNPNGELSDHLRSRLMVAKELKKGKTPVTFLRAAVIIGAESASYKIIKHLIQKCPVFLFPVKANSLCQPIAIRDVIKYLVGSLENQYAKGKTLDIGGPDVFTYLEMLKIQAQVVGKKRYFIPTLYSKMNIYARVSSWFTPVSFQLVKSLMESCLMDVVCKENEIKQLLPFETLSYREALERALVRQSYPRLYLQSDTPSGEEKKSGPTTFLSPPTQSSGILADIRYFMLRRPTLPTLIKFSSREERENYSYRILQRLEIGVSNYKILNIHKIGVNAPAKYVFEELLKWNGDSSCWPNHIAKVVRKKKKLENLHVYLFGWKEYPGWLKKFLLKWKLIPLFQLNAIRFKLAPDPADTDNARYLLFRSSGGYPIGIFSLYVRSSIAEQNEKEPTQLFLMVGFNFYGKKHWSTRKGINRTWEMIHDRVTSNVLNRLKQLSEWRFAKIQDG